MKEFVTSNEANYYSRITSIMVNGKRAYELKGKFLDDLHDNDFSGTNREDAVEHIEYFLKIVDPINLPNVNYERLRLSVFPISLVGNASEWFDECQGVTDEEIYDLKEANNDDEQETAAPLPANTTATSQDVPYASTSPTNQEIQSQVIHQGNGLVEIYYLEGRMMVFRISCVLWIFGLYSSRLFDSACTSALNLLKKGLLVQGKAKTTSKRRLQIADPEPEGSTKDIPLDSVVVLRYEKRSKSENKGNVLTEMELVLEQTQQVIRMASAAAKPCQGDSSELYLNKDGVKVYDSNCDDIPNSQPSFMANILSYGSDALAEVHNLDNMDNNMINQGVQVKPPFKQSSVVNHSETEITSDSNIIRYSHISDSCELSVKIDRLKQTLSEQLKEKESLMQTFTLLINDFKKEESRNIDREIALEKKIKQLYNIVFKRDQSAQTVHMLTKPQFSYDHTTKQALGFQNPFYLKKAQ
nr:hypothetical protein [Tanacetum cinerariifolium]